MNKYYYRSYLIFKLNIYALFLAVVVRHVSCSLRIYFIIYKLFSYLLGLLFRSYLYNSYANNYGILGMLYIAMALSKGRCSNLKGIVREFFNAMRVHYHTPVFSDGTSTTKR